MPRGNEDDRLDGRDGEIWRAYVGGSTQEAIASRFGISQSRVSQIIAAVRASVQPEEKEHLVQREIDFLDQLRERMMAAVDAPLPPAFTQSGKILTTPGGHIVLDDSSRLAAVDRAVRLHERLSKLLGLDAAQKLDVTTTEAAQAQAAKRAAEAAAYLAEGE